MAQISAAGDIMVSSPLFPWVFTKRPSFAHAPKSDRERFEIEGSVRQDPHSLNQRAVSAIRGNQKRERDAQGKEDACATPRCGTQETVPVYVPRGNPTSSSVFHHEKNLHLFFPCVKK